MSAGYPSEGPGCISWWGFSPARDLLNAGPQKCGEHVNVLLIGSGDPRHILKTIAGLQDNRSLHVWVIENSMELVARQLLLLHLALTPTEIMGFNEKTEVFLELFGNSKIRSQTEEILKQVAAQLSLYVTDALEGPAHACLNTATLKFKERDELVRIFKLWSQSERMAPALMTKAWNYRVRQHLGSRYDSRKGCFDWDLSMKLYEKNCGVISKQQYVQWREQGLAFELREGNYQTTNPTLLSYRILSQRRDKVAVIGYWGDIVSSPYLSYGIETDEKNLLKTHNGQHMKTAQDISFENLLLLFQSLSSRRSCPPTPMSDGVAVSPCNQNSGRISDLMEISGVCVTFMPLDSLKKMPEKQKYPKFFNVIYFSAGCVHQLHPTIGQIAAPDALLVVELAKFILDLNKEQEAGFAKTVSSMAQEAGFQPWSEGSSDDVHAVFTLQKA